jgi:hypothetical protein
LAPLSIFAGIDHDSERLLGLYSVESGPRIDGEFKISGLGPRGRFNRDSLCFRYSSAFPASTVAAWYDRAFSLAWSWARRDSSGFAASFAHRASCSWAWASFSSRLGGWAFGAGEFILDVLRVCQL